MTGKPFIARTGALLIGCVVLAGCGKADSGVGASGFSSAAPAIKEAWEKAAAADKVNDYVPAVRGYKQILIQRDQLSLSQVKTVEEASSKLFQRLVEAANKGDPEARQALSQLQPTRPGP